MTHDEYFEWASNLKKGDQVIVVALFDNSISLGQVGNVIAIDPQDPHYTLRVRFNDADVWVDNGALDTAANPFYRPAKLP